MRSLVILCIIPVALCQWDFNPFAGFQQQRPAVRGPQAQGQVSFPRQPSNRLEEISHSIDETNSLTEETIDVTTTIITITSTMRPAQLARFRMRQRKLKMRAFRQRRLYGIPGQRNANQKLRTCCRSLSDADIECRRRYCDFNALSPNTVLGYLAQCSPKGPTVGKMWDCASSRADHRPCCQRMGVIPACMQYCETTNGVPTDYLKYIVCVGQFDSIRFCFKEHLESHPNIKGDT